MAQHPLGELLAKHHIQRYLLRKMDPIGALNAPGAGRFQQAILNSFGFRFGLCQETLARPMEKMGPIRLVAQYAQPKQMQARLNHALEQLYTAEQAYEVEKLITLLALPRTAALHVFRNRYEITEKVLPYAESLKQIGHVAPLPEELPASTAPLREIPIGIIYPRPHIQRYLLRKLNPIAAPGTPLVARFQQAMAEGLGLLVRIRDEAVSRPWDQFGPIALELSLRDATLKNVHLDLNSAMEHAFVEEHNAAVDNLHYSKRFSKGKSIRIFRSRYEITEDVLPLDTSVKMYQRHEVQQRRATKRGRPARGTSMRVLDDDREAE